MAIRPEAPETSQPAIPLNRAQRRSASRRSRTLVGAGLIALSGLATGYLQALRPPVAYGAPRTIPACGQADVTVTDDTGLRNAIRSSHDDSVICISGTITLQANLPTLDDTTVTFVGDDSTVDAIDGAGLFSMVRADFTVAGDDTVTIADLGLRNGYVALQGGSVYVRDGGLVLDRVLFDGSVAGNGGGAVYSSYSDVTITDSVFQGNHTAGVGGALHLRDLNAALSNVTVSDSYAYAGGALYVNTAILDISDSTFEGNAATTYAGAAAFTSSQVTVSDTSFTANTAMYTGAIRTLYTDFSASTVSITDDSSVTGANVYLRQGTARFENSFIGDNTTLNGSAGIIGYLSDVDLVFTTVYGNSHTTGSATDVDFVAGSLDAWGSVVGNSADDTVMRISGGTVLDDTYSVSTGPGVGFSGPGSHDVTGGTLQLGALDDTGTPGHGGRTPAASSLLVTGAPSNSLGTGLTSDQLGNPRPGSGTTWTIGARQVDRGTPTPPPLYPPSAPRNPDAEPGDATATVTWDPPEDPGSFPITDYRVTSQPGGRSCLATAPTTTCTVTGLTNGQPYTFTVQALNGVGWGLSSRPTDPVTPRSRVMRLTLNQGTRVADGNHDRIRTTGSSVNIPAGARLTPYIRYTGQAAFSAGKATITVQEDGTFRWTRKVKKNRGLTAYVAYVDVRSNQVVWQRVQ